MPCLHRQYKDVTHCRCQDTASNKRCVCVCVGGGGGGGGREGGKEEEWGGVTYAYCFLYYMYEQSMKHISRNKKDGPRCYA